MKSLLVEKILATEGLGEKGFFEAKGRVYTFLNPVSYLDALEHEGLFGRFDSIFADGSLLVAAIKMCYGETVSRRSFDMTSLAPELMEYACKEGKSVYESGFSGYSTYYALKEVGIDCMVIHAADVPTTQYEEVMKDKTQEYQLLWPELNTDGHCSYSPDGEYVITDTYPNRKRLASVFLCREDGYCKRIARVFAPFRYDFDCRCDLHPRWSRDGKKVCIDSVHEGRRALYVIPIDKD